MKVLLYARVSTDNQANQGHSLDAQLFLLRNYARTNNHLIVGEFVDRGLSGRSDDREAFLSMISLATATRSGIKAILVHKFDRFSRSRQDAVFYKALLKKHGVAVISITEPVEDTPAGLLVEGILETIAEFYSRNLAEEVKKGQLQAASKGLNQSEAPLGYTSKSGVLTIVDSEALIVKAIFTQFLQGSSLREITQNIARTFQLQLHPSTISYILRNQAYVGDRVWNKRDKRGRLRDESEWVIATGSHEAIISRSLFTEVQKKLKTKKRILRTHLFSGLCRCLYCQSKLHCHKAKNNVWLICSKKNQGCLGVRIKESELQEVVLTELNELILHSEPRDNNQVMQALLDAKPATLRLILLASIDLITIGRDKVVIDYQVN